MQVIQVAYDFVSGMQTEILVFLIAVGFHSLIFGKHRIAGAGFPYKPSKGASSPKAAKPARIPNQAHTSFARSVAAGTTPEGDLQAFQTEIIRHLPTIPAGQEVEALEVLMAGLARSGGAELPRAVREVLHAQGLQSSVRLTEQLMRCCLRHRLSADVLELLSTTKFVSPEALAGAALLAERSGDVALAREVMAKLSPTPTPEVAGPLLRLAQSKDVGFNALALYERHFDGVDLSQDVQAQHAVAAAALQAGRGDVVAKLVACPEAGASALVRSFAAEGNFEAARNVFKACPTKTSSLYNALLSVAVDCRDLAAAVELKGEAVVAGLADVVTYNTIIKAHLQNGALGRAREVLGELRTAGLEPNCVTFNELIDATAKKSLRDMWELINDMQSCGLKPNQVTCSIVLKSIQSCSRPEDFEKAMAVVEQAGDAMDEVLLSSLCEACIRSRRSDLLARVLQQQRSSRGIAVKGAHTYGSLIRAHGSLGDLEGAWEAWKEMKTRRIAPTCITLGCMVEAVAKHGNPEAGYRLIREALAEASTRPLVNAVIYCSVLKAFSHNKCFDRVWKIHAEMRELKLQYSIVTYNALIDACARSCEMKRITPLLEEMANDKIEPNVITYSTVLKGYCQENRLDRAFEVLADMKKNKDFSPDEVTYNTLLDGCARFGMFDRGMEVFKDMEEAGVKPSNFTVSVLVKLANRSKRPAEAFELAEQVARKYNFRPNMHVYNNLMNCCTARGQQARALEVFEQMLDERIRPDSRTYKILLQCCVQNGEKEQAAGLLRAATGLAPHYGRFSASVLQPKGGVASDVVMDTLEGLVNSCKDEALALELYRELRAVPGLSLDPKKPMRWASGGMRGGRFD